MPRLSILLFIILLGAEGCKKSATPLVLVSQVQFQVNGDVYSFGDTITPYYGSSPSILMETNLFYFTRIPPCADAAGTTFSPLLHCDYPSFDSLKPGVYTYVTSPGDTLFNGGDLSYSSGGQRRLWSILLSDTLTITSIDNGYASGTFSASYMVSLDTPSVIHLTEGVFKGADVLYHLPAP